MPVLQWGSEGIWGQRIIWYEGKRVCLQLISTKDLSLGILGAEIVVGTRASLVKNLQP